MTEPVKPQPSIVAPPDTIEAGMPERGGHATWRERLLAWVRYRTWLHTRKLTGVHWITGLVVSNGVDADRRLDSLERDLGRVAAALNRAVQDLERLGVCAKCGVVVWLAHERTVRFQAGPEAPQGCLCPRCAKSVESRIVIPS